MDIKEFLERDAAKDILRLSTAGSVDDGKSTLIGRLLHDSKMIYEDTLASIKKASGKINSDVEMDFSLLTDGLKAEREQGITIDVAYRYFSTPKRKFIIADTPGHEQYTRNMATGASTADLAIILIDARNGVLTQSRRHAFISSLLRIPHMAVAINKMDIVGYSADVYERIKADFSEFAVRLSIQDLHFIPISALKGDNVVERSPRTPWYNGPSLMEYLESIYIGSDRNLVDLRLPIQHVLRPNLDFRGFSGQIASGIIKKGDPVLALPSKRRTKIKSIIGSSGETDYAFAPQSVTVTTEDEVDISRGDMIVHLHNLPHQERRFEAMIVWMSETPMEPGTDYFIKHTCNSTRGRVESLLYKVDVDTLSRLKSPCLKMNEIGRAVIYSKKPLLFDPYAKNRGTGSFILVDVISNNTVAAGMIIDRESSKELSTHLKAESAGKNAPPATELLSIDERAAKLGQRPATVWLTGLPSSGKAEIARLLEKSLFMKGRIAVALDGQTLRTRLNRDLDFTGEDREENLRRAAEMARILNSHCILAVCAFVSPKASEREMVARIVGESRFVEVFVNASREWCESRDKDGIYKKAREGRLDNLPGIDLTYEAPVNPALELNPERTGLEAAAKLLEAKLAALGFIP